MSGSGAATTAGVSATSFPAPANAVVIAAGANIQAVVNEYPPGTAFLLSAGTYSGQTITPQSGDSFYGQSGTVLDLSLIHISRFREPLWNGFVPS